MVGFSSVAGSAGAGFLVQGPDMSLLWSADGLDWQDVADASLAPIIALTANDKGFAAAKGNLLPNGSVLFSPDGRHWESHSVGTSADFWRVNSGPAGFLLISGCDFVVMFSEDGRDWTRTDLPPRCGSFRAAQTDDGWVAISNHGVFSSSDGVSWTEVESQEPFPQVPPPTSWLGHEGALRNVSLSTDGETVVLAGKDIGGGFWVSHDNGVTWTDKSESSGEVEMAVGDFGFVGVAPGRVVVSSDGSSWIEHRVEMDFHDVAAVGDTVVATAVDGIYTWTPPAGALPRTGIDATALTLTAFVLVAAGGVLLRVRRYVLATA